MQVNVNRPVADDERSIWERIGSVLRNPDPVSRAGAERIVADLQLQQARDDLQRRAEQRRINESISEGTGLGSLERSFLYDVPPGSFAPGTLTTPVDETPETPVDLSSIFNSLDVPAETGGYTPSLVDTSAAERMFILEQTPEEQAALEFALADLEARATAGTQAVRQGWEQVRAVNSAAAAKAAEMARNSGPEAAQLWLDAANSALTLSAQAGEALATTPGMQRVNISPTAGAERISALLAAEAPRAQALAERLGAASAEEIAAQARTAAMMGEAYAGDIQRTLLIEANRTRQEHNERVLNRIAAERQAVAQMRFQAAQTNAQLLSQAAAAATQNVDPNRRRTAVRNFLDDIERVATFDNPADGAALLVDIYPNLDTGDAVRLIESAKQGLLDYRAALALAESGG